MRMLTENDEHRTTLNRKQREKKESTIDQESEVGLQPSSFIVPQLASLHLEPRKTTVKPPTFQQREDYINITATKTTHRAR